MTAEGFIPIPGYEKYGASKRGLICNLKTGKILKFSYDKQGYVRVGLYVGNYKSKTIKTHKLVALTYIPNTKNLPCINHIDGNKENNSVSNLEWISHSDNLKHAFKMGLKSISKNERERFIDMAKRATNGLNPASKKVKDTNTGEIFETVSLAAEYSGLKRTTLIAMLSGQNPNKTNLRYHE